MYILVSKVADNYAILDTTDGAVDWLDLNSIKSLVGKGISIAGVEGGNLRPQDYILQPTLCNWAGGQNVFQVGRGFVLSSKMDFKFIAGKKTYKGKILTRNGDVVQLRFNFGIITQVNMSVLEAMSQR